MTWSVDQSAAKEHITSSRRHLWAAYIEAGMFGKPGELTVCNFHVCLWVTVVTHVGTCSTLSSRYPLS